MFTLIRSKCGLSFGTATILSYNNGHNRFFSSNSDCEGSSNNNSVRNSSREVSLNGKVVLITGATAGIGSKINMKDLFDIVIKSCI